MFGRIGVLIFIFSIYISANSQLLESEYYDDYMIRMSGKYIKYVYLSERIYHEGKSTEGKTDNIFGEPWKLLKYTSEKNGFQGGLYYKKYRDEYNRAEYIVSFGGTTANPKELNSIQKVGGSLLDLGADLTLLSNLLPTTQAESALNFVKNVENEFNIKVNAIVGHSLGGGLAAYTGLYYDIQTYTVNSAPIPFTYTKSLEKFYINHAIKTPRKRPWGKELKIEFTHTDKITNIMSNNDPMTNFNFLLKRLDNKHFNPTNPATPLNALKLAMLIPIQLRLDYIFVGKNIKLSVDTGHGSGELLNKMKEAFLQGHFLNYKLDTKVYFLGINGVSTIYNLFDDDNLNRLNPKKTIKTEDFINMVMEAYNRTHIYDTKLSADIFGSLSDKLYINGSSIKFKETIFLKDAIAVMYYLFEHSYDSRFKENKIYAKSNIFVLSRKYYINFLKYFRKDIQKKYQSFYYLKIRNMYFIYGGILFKNSSELNNKLTKATAISMIYNYMKYNSVRDKGE